MADEKDKEQKKQEQLLQRLQQLIFQLSVLAPHNW